MVVILLLIAAIGLRLFRLDDPLFIGGASRQVQTADITRNLYRGGLQHMLTPQVSYFGPEKVNFIVEFPLYNAVVAGLYWIGGGVDEKLGRLVSISSWGLFSIFFFLLIRRIANIRIAILAFLFSAFIPIHVLMSRNFQPDEMMLAFGIAALFFFVKFAEKTKLRWFIFGSISFTLALLIKPTVLAFFFPLFYLFFQTYGKKFYIRGQCIIFTLLTLTPFAIWRWYASRQDINPILAEGTKRLEEWFDPSLFFHVEYYRALFNIEYANIVSSVGVLLIALGLMIVLWRKYRRGFILSWLFGCLVVVILFQKHFMTHPYYHLIFVPSASLLMAIAYDEILRRCIPAKHKMIQGILLFLILFFFAPTISSFVFQVPEKYAHVLEEATAIQRLTSKETVIIGASGSNPTLVYYADRRGWSFLIDRTTLEKGSAFWGITNIELDPVKELETLRIRGAEYFVSGRGELESNQHLYQYLDQYYPVRHETSSFIIFSLKEKREG